MKRINELIKQDELMKAQISVEFLLNFLLMLALISILVTAFSHLLVSAKIHSAKILKKAELEEFVRTIDLSLTIRNARFSMHGKYSITDINNESVVVGKISDEEQIQSFSIYRIDNNNDNNGEPI